MLPQHLRTLAQVSQEVELPLEGAKTINSGDSWNPIVRDLPKVLSVEVQSLP